MEKEIGYHAINMCNYPLIVSNKDKTKVLGIIYPKQRFVVLDSWICNENNCINSMVKFTNNVGEFINGYLYDINYINQVSSWSQWSFGDFFIVKAGNCNIFHIGTETSIYDEEGNFVKTIGSDKMVASFNCKNHPIYENLMSVDYIKSSDITNANWIKFNGFIDTKININPLNTPVYGRFD